MRTFNFTIRPFCHKLLSIQLKADLAIKYKSVCTKCVGTLSFGNQVYRIIVNAGEENTSLVFLYITFMKLFNSNEVSKTTSKLTILNDNQLYSKEVEEKRR